MNKRLLNGIGLLLLALAVSSCGPKAGLDIQKTMSDARQMAMEGRVDQALADLESLYNSRHYTAYQPMLLSVMLQIEVNTNRVEAAQKRFLKVAGKSPGVAAQSFGIIENELMSKKEFQPLINWCVSLSSFKLGDATLTQIANRQILALVSLGQTGEVVQVIGRYLPLLTEPAAVNLVNSYFSAAINDRQWDRAESLLSVMDKSVKDSSGKQIAKVGFQVNLVLARDGWKAADAFVREMMLKIPDAGAARILRMVGAAEVAANELASADELYEAGMVADENRTLLREAAAVGWINVQVKRAGSVEDLIGRLSALQTKKLPVNLIVSLVSQNYAKLFGTGTPKSFDALNQLCESLRGSKQAEMSHAQLDGILLDISYFREDYEGSLKIIERGLVIDDPTKKDMMVDKVKAHLAIKKGDYKEAVVWLRKFMEQIGKDHAYTVDPIDQVRISSDMILGLNARRIGDLWGKAGNAEESLKAYAEARQHYADALKEFPDASTDENKKIIREMNAIPPG